MLAPLAIAAALWAAWAPSEEWQVFYNQGAEALARGEPRDAVSPFRKALALAPDNPKILHGLVIADLAGGRTGPALENSRRLLQIMREKSVDFGTAMSVAQALAQHNQPAESIEYLKLAQPHAPPVIDGTSSTVFFDKLYATLLARMRQDREAIARLENLVRSDPGDAGHVYQLGLMLIKAAKFPAAWDVLHRGIERFPQSFEVRLGYALACYFNGRNDEAERAYRQLVRMRPDAPEPYFALGNFYADTGRDTDAVQAFSRAVRLDAGNYLYHYMYGIELFRTEKVSEAQAQLQRAIRLNPRHADSQFWLGKTYLAREEPEPALQAFETAVRLEPKHIGAYYQLALLYKRKGETAKAREALRARAELTRQLHQGIVAERMQ